MPKGFKLVSSLDTALVDRLNRSLTKALAQVHVLGIPDQLIAPLVGT